MNLPPFIRSIAITGGGIAISQIMILAATPLLTRLYNPEDFGLLAILTGVISVLAVLSSLRYAQALAIAETDHERNNILILCNIITVIMALIIVIFILIYEFIPLGSSYHFSFSTIAWLMPIGFLFVGLQNTYRLLHISHKYFYIVSISQILRTVTTVIVQIFLFSLGGLGIALGFVVGYGISVLILIIPAFRDLYKKKYDLYLSDIRLVAIRYRDFPLYSSWSGFLNNLTQYLPYFVLPIYFGSAGAGFFLLANRVVFSPISLVVRSTADVLIPYAAEARKEGTLGVLVARLVKNISTLAAVPVIILVTISPQLFQVIFGEQWELSGVIAQILAVSVFFNVIGNPLTRLFAISELQKMGLKFNIILGLSRAAGLIVGGLQGDIILATTLYVIASGVVWFGFIISINMIVGNSVGMVLSSLLGALLAPICMIVPYWIVVILNLNYLIQKWVLIIGVIFIIAYGCRRLWLDLAKNITNNK